MFGKPIETRFRQTFLTLPPLSKTMRGRVVVRGKPPIEDEGLVRQETPRGVALGMGVFLTAFGSVFGGFPLWGLIMTLQEGYSIGEMIFPLAVFGLFILVGGLVLFLGLKSLIAGITGQGLVFYVPEDHLQNEVEVDLSQQYISEEELLKQIHGTSTPEEQTMITKDDTSPPSTSGGFWGEIIAADDED